MFYRTKMGSQLDSGKIDTKDVVKEAASTEDLQKLAQQLLVEKGIQTDLKSLSQAFNDGGKKNHEKDLSHEPFKLYEGCHTDRMPLPSEEHNKQIIQYVGATTEQFTMGKFYQVVEDQDHPGQYLYKEVKVQEAEIMSQPSELNKGEIYRYTGATTEQFNTGNFYQVVEDQDHPGQYLYKEVKVMDFRREYTGETFNKYRERFSKFFNLQGKGYEITRIWVETNTEKLRFEIKYTTDNDYDISQKVYANITGQYQEDINDDNSFKVLDIRYSPIIGTYKVENGEVFVHDLVYDVPHIADKPSKKMDFDCLFNPDATDRHVREILEKKKATFDDFHIDKELAPKDYPQMRYNADLIKKGQPRNYETSAMAKIDLDKSLKNNIVLDKNITKEDKKSPYERKLLYKYGEGENDYLDLGHTIEYGFDAEGNLEIQGGLSEGEHIVINGFLFYNVKIEKDPNDPLNVHISFDQDELKRYGEHMKTGFMKICEAINNGSIGAEFTNLNKTVRRMQGADGNSVNAFDGTKIKGFYSVELYAPTENTKKAENTPKDILYLQYDESEGIQIIDGCGKTVEQMTCNSPNKTVIEPSIIENGEKLRLRETKGKAPEYQYLTINVEGHQNLQGRVNEDGPRTEANDEVYGPMALIENGKQYAEFTVNWNEKTGYSFEQENNKIDLKPEYFYHKLPDINQLGLNGKIAGFSDSTLKKYFDQEFDGLNLEPQSGIVFDGKFYKVEMKGNILTLKEEYPPEVKKCNEKIEKKVNAIKAMADNLKIMYGGKSMDKVQGGSMGFGTFFKLENFDPDGFVYGSGNLSFVCQMTNLEDEEDIVFEYNEDKGIFEFVPDPTADPANTFTISDNTYKISYDSKKYTIKLDLQDYKNDDAVEPEEEGRKEE